MLNQREIVAQLEGNTVELFTEWDAPAWAIVLTNQQREAAEDLVQDAFVQFMVERSRLEEIENIDGYQRRMLCYMHVSRLRRSAQHLHETAVSHADYDSGRRGWTAIDPPLHMQAFEELCTYACFRKESSRAGSVFILRFFLEYFPTEIAAVLNSSRHCVDGRQRLARREAKVFTNEARRLRFVNNKTSSGRQHIRYLKSDRDLMLDLRQMIFKSCKGVCLSQSDLIQIYSEGHTDSLTTAKLAHIVSCHACLDAVNGLLGLPSLANRYRTETSEPKEPPADATGGASGGSSDDLMKKFEHRQGETHDHNPHELRIAVNGTLVKATLTLNKSNLHAIEQTLVVQRGDDDLREYRFGEANLEPSSAVDPKVFEIDSTLTGGAGKTGSSGDWAIRDLTNSRVPPTPSTSAPPTASAELEVDVAYLLNQAKADRNEQVTLTRSAGGSLRVEGVVDTAERKQEFLRTLAPVANNPAVRIEIRTVAEATQRAIELKKLVARFATVEMRTVTPDVRSKWLAVVHEHADAFKREAGLLFQDLQPVSFPDATVSAPEDVLIQSDVELGRAVEKLYQLAFFCNEAVSSALSISSHSSATTIKSSEFRKSLINAENLTKRIGQYER